MWQRHLPASPVLEGHIGSLGGSSALPPFSPSGWLGETSPVKFGGSVAPLPPSMDIHPRTYPHPYNIPSPRQINPHEPPSLWQQGIYLTYLHSAIPVDYGN